MMLALRIVIVVALVFTVSGIALFGTPLIQSLASFLPRPLQDNTPVEQVVFDTGTFNLTGRQEIPIQLKLNYVYFWTVNVTYGEIRLQLFNGTGNAWSLDISNTTMTPVTALTVGMGSLHANGPVGLYSNGRGLTTFTYHPETTGDYQLALENLTEAAGWAICSVRVTSFLEGRITA